MNFIELNSNKATRFFKKLLEKHDLPLGSLQNRNFQRWAVGVILCLILAVILAPEINISAPEFKQGMIAPRNIKADHSFQVEDQQATELKKKDTGDANPVFFQVEKNEMIVREGEKIGYLELAKLNAFFKSTEKTKLFKLLYYKLNTKSKIILLIPPVLNFTVPHPYHPFQIAGRMNFTGTYNISAIFFTSVKRSLDSIIYFIHTPPV